jgi:DNA-binding transcriptional ArsR family regulator
MNAFEAVDALAALAHEHRLGVYRLLVKQGSAGLPAGTIGARVRLPPSTLTFHLQYLLRAGLLIQRRVSRQLYYSADFTAMNALIGYLTENCCTLEGGSCAAESKPVARTKLGRSARRTA